MTKKLFLGNKEMWRIFPSVETLAYYHPLGNFINLNKITESQLLEILKEPLLHPMHFSVIIHELQHWQDHISTLWGQRKLLKIFKAFESSLMGNEIEMFKMKSLFDDFKRDRLATYYSESYSEIQGDKNSRWKYEFSTGIRFNHEGKLDESKSIIFVRFKANNDEPISRVPLSVASLLETTATNSELLILCQHLLSLGEDERIVEARLFNDRLIKNLYNPELTLYSVAVHTASNILKISDPIVGYKIASMFATLALNLPSLLIPKIKVPIAHTNTWGARTINMLVAEDRGYVFLCLVQNYRDAHGVYNGEVFNINDVLSSSDLPGLEDLEKLVKDETNSYQKEALLEKNIFMNILGTKYHLGLESRNVNGIAQEKSATKALALQRKSDFPYFICNDTYFEYDNVRIHDIVNKIAKGETLSREEWWRVFEDCETRIDNFSEICGV